MNDQNQINLTKVEVYLRDEDLEKAKQLGNGHASVGLATALGMYWYIKTLRQQEKEERQNETT